MRALRSLLQAYDIRLDDVVEKFGLKNNLAVIPRSLIPWSYGTVLLVKPPPVDRRWKKLVPRHDRQLTGVRDVAISGRKDHRGAEHRRN